MTVRNTVLRTFLQPCLCLLPLLLPASAFGEEGDGKSPEIETRIISFRQCTAWFNKQFSYAIDALPVEVEQASDSACEQLHYLLFQDNDVAELRDVAPVMSYCLYPKLSFMDALAKSLGQPRDKVIMNCIDYEKSKRRVIRACQKELSLSRDMFISCISNAEPKIKTSPFMIKEGIFNQFLDPRKRQQRELFFTDHIALNTSYKCRYTKQIDRLSICQKLMPNQAEFGD